jgi:hypothetical protein
MFDRPRARFSALSVLLALTACGGTGGDPAGSIDAGPGGTGGMSIVACSLGCSSTLSGAISCGVNQVYVNQELTVEFSQPVDPTSLNSLSFRVVSQTGSSPSGQYSVDPANSRRAIFRPLVSFGSDGLPQFGLDPALTYTLKVPAFTAGDLGFFVRSVGGSKNTTELNCSVVPSLGVNDIVPGAPVVTTYVEEIEKVVVDGEVVGVNVLSSTNILQVQPGVSPSSRVRFVFNDVMNPATLVNAVTGTSDFIEVRVDIDGLLTDSTDQLAIPGAYTLDIIQTPTKNETEVIFTPKSTFPTAGIDDGGPPRQIVIVLPPTITDLGGNPLANSGKLSFITTLQDSPILEDVSVDFANAPNYVAATVDAAATGMLLDTGFTGSGLGETFDGRMLRALGGGSGRLGSLVVEPGEELILSTGPVPTVFGPELTTGPVESGGAVVQYNVQSTILDDGLYPIDPFPDLNGNEWFEDGVLDNGPGTTNWTVSDGVFEFASLEVKSGGRITFVGDNPVRLFVRGSMLVDGLVRAEGLSGTTDHDALGEFEKLIGAIPVAGPDDNGNGVADGFGSAGALGGAGGARGGDGGDRSIASNLVGVGPVGGGATNAPPGGAFPWNFAGFSAAAPGDIQLDGSAGLGRSGAGPAGGDDFGAGQPGSRFPVDFPGQTTGTISDFGGLVFNNFCQSIQFAAGGTGGSFAAPGGLPDYIIPPGLASLGGAVDPVIPVPSSSVLRAFEQELDPARPGGGLIGGSGGGGGGTGAAYCKSSGLPFNCGFANPALGPSLQYLEFYDGSGCGGGGGGGAMQVQVGYELEVNGAISVRGGVGGGLLSNAPPVRGATAPGGGGSGGSLLVQAYVLDLADFPGILDVSGGDGGRVQPTGSLGGVGSPGILQVENGSSLADPGLPADFLPFAQDPLLSLVDDPVNGIIGVGTRVTPVLSISETTQSGGPFNVDDVLRVDGWAPNNNGPGASYGLQSCWLVPNPDAFSVQFVGDADDGSGGVDLGWDLLFELGGLVSTGEVVSYRGEPSPAIAALTGGLSIEEATLNSLGNSPIVVRWQGARAVEPIEDPCQVFLSGPASPLLAGSLTPWLASPDEVTEYWLLLSDANPYADVNAEVSPDRQVSAGLASQRQANVIRAQVVIDTSDPLGAAIFSVVELRLRALTD